MKLLELLLFVLVGYTFFWAFYVVALPVWARVRRTGRTSAPRETALPRLPRIAIMIPAHNMASHVESCIASLRACNYPADRLAIFIIADHCTDETRPMAEACDAVVLERTQDPAGKSYAIAWCLEQLASRAVDPDIYVVIDATVQVHPEFLSAVVSKWAEGEDIVVGFASADPSKQKWFVRCMGLTLTHRRLQNEAREALRLSSLIEGRGMAYSRSYIDRFGWRLALPDTGAGGTHPTEDWRHGVRAAEQGVRVAFAEQARVYTPIREKLGAATQQGLRWEHGRIGNALTHGLRLLRKSIAQRERVRLFAALDSVQPPVAILLGVSLFASAGGLMMFGLSAKGIAASWPALFVLYYATVVVAHGRRDGIALWTLLWAPLYILWRFFVFAIVLTRLDRMFVRRERTASINR
jgi:cellulose synthase/poly-beta-1,6-N-acetylglucosamine synthase-like glycosyltransferase